MDCFDSLSINEEKKSLIVENCKFKGIKDININETPFQSKTSISCGLFAIFFLIQRSYNLDLDFEELLEEIFVESVDENEKIVKLFCDNIIEKKN